MLKLHETRNAHAATFVVVPASAAGPSLTLCAHTDLTLHVRFLSKRAPMRRRWEAEGAGLLLLYAVIIVGLGHTPLDLHWNMTGGS